MILAIFTIIHDLAIFGEPHDTSAYYSDFMFRGGGILGVCKTFGDFYNIHDYSWFDDIWGAPVTQIHDIQVLCFAISGYWAISRQLRTITTMDNEIENITIYNAINSYLIYIISF